MQYILTEISRDKDGNAPDSNSNGLAATEGGLVRNVKLSYMPARYSDLDNYLKYEDQDDSTAISNQEYIDNIIAYVNRV